MSGIESLIKTGMRLGTQKFAEGGSVSAAEQYLQSLGLDTGLFGTHAAGDIGYAKWGDTTGGMGDYPQYNYVPTDSASFYAGIQDPLSLGQYQLSAGRFSTIDKNYGITLDPQTGQFTKRLKTADKEAVSVPYKQQPDGSWAPDWNAAYKSHWDTNAAEVQNNIMGIVAALGLGGAMVGAAGAAGAAAGAAGGGGAAAEGLGGAAFLPEAAGAITGAEGFAPLYGGLGTTEAALGAGTGAGLGTLGGAGEVVMPGVTITAPAAATPLPAWIAPVAGAGIGALPDGAPGEGGPSIDQTQQYTPEEGPYAPGESPGTINAPAEAPFDWWEWVKTHPRELISGIGTVGSIIDDNTGSSGSGGSGGGSGTGWNGPISNFSANQTYTPAPENYRPGFSPEHVYMRTSYEAGNPREPTMNQGIAAALPPAPPPNIPPIQNPYIAIDPSSAFPEEERAGIGALPKSKAVGYAAGGMTKGPGDGMSDHIPATIEGQQPAVLSAEEFVVPADVVSHLGNGSSEAGAKVLYAMMDRIRQARTGNSKQARQINPAQFLP